MTVSAAGQDNAADLLPLAPDRPAADSGDAPSSNGADVPSDEPVPFARPRDFFDAARIDESQLRALIDDRDWEESENETLCRLLYRIQQIELSEIDEWTLRDTPPARAAEEPQTYRTDVFPLDGRVKSVRIRSLISELVARYGYRYYYEIDFAPSDGTEPITIFSAEVPAVWKTAAEEERPLDEKASLQGFFLKRGAPVEQGRPRLYFAAKRIAWYPDRVQPAMNIGPMQVLLAQKGMNIALLDDVVDRSSLTSRDRECFYQLMATVGKIDAETIYRMGNEHSNLGNDLLKEKVSSKLHGQAFTFEGRARRAQRILLGDADDDIRRELGIDHYYQIVVFIPTEGFVPEVRDINTQEKREFLHGYPVVLCATELPPGMPEGAEIDEHVVISGVFCKYWAYRSMFLQPSDGTPREEILDPEERESLIPSPLLIGPPPRWIPSQQATSTFWNGIFGALFLVALVGIWFGMWIYGRQDKRFQKETLARRFEPADPRTLDDMQLPDQGPPDFRREE